MARAATLASAIPRGSTVAHRLHQAPPVLETSAAIGLLLFPIWVTITFLWWRRLAPPRLVLARIYMALGAAWSVGNLMYTLCVFRPHGAAHHVFQQHVGALVVLASLYAEIFVRWLRVRQGVDHLAPMWILRRSGRRRPPPRLVADP